MINEKLWGYFDNDFPSNIVVNLTLEELKKLEKLAKYYNKPKQEIISAIILHEWNLQETVEKRTEVIKKSRKLASSRKRVMFRVSQQVKNRYNRLTYNTNGIMKSDYIGTWIEKEHEVIREID